MFMKILQYTSIIVLMGYSCPLWGGISFGSKESEFKFGDNSSLFVTNGLTISKGMLNVGAAELVLNESIVLNDANFSGKDKGSFSASGSTNGVDKVYLSDDERFQSLISYKPYQCIVSGTVGHESWFTGDVAFEAFTPGDPFLSFANANAVLRLGLNSTGASDINLNGGTLILENDLAFATVNTNCFLGGGNVECWGSTVSFGGDGFIWPTGKIAWKWRPVINLIGNVILHGRWDLGVPGESDKIYINGNGNTLDISDGKLRVVGKSTLILSNVKIKGLNVTDNGTVDAVSNIEFGDSDAKIMFNRVELEMDSDWTLTTGGIYVSGSSTIVNKDHTLTFGTGSSLTVDGCALWYDTLIYPDNNGIKPFEEDDPDHNILTLLHNGQIKHITSYQAGTILINETFETRTPVQLRSPEEILRSLTPSNSVTYDLADVRDLSPTKPYAVNVNTIINGNTNTINFAKTTGPVIKVRAAKTLTFQDIALNNFRFNHVSLGSASNVIFGDGTDILWGANYALTQTMTFQGECKLDGNGKTITLSRFGGFEVAPDSSLLLQNITIKGLTKNHLRCLDDTAAISFGGKVKLCLSDDLFFDEGHFEIMPAALLDVRGTESFIYRSDQQSFINSGGTFQLSGGAIFSYEPRSNNHDLIVFNDEDANLKLNRGALASTTTGMRLTSGTLQIAGPKNYIRAADIASPTISESIVFGNGVDVTKNLAVEFSNGKLTLETGALIWANVEDNL